MEVIFHVYHHLLFRHNDQLWPLWVREGMAEVYSTFQTDGHQAWIAAPIPHHLQTLHQRPLLQLSALFAVTPGSPEYNEADRQGVFYAQSWLLTHFLMSGDNMNDRARFGQFTTLLRQGQLPVTAFTNALQVSLAAVQKDLGRYLNQGVFQPIHLSLAADVSGPVTVSIRRIPSPPGRRWNHCSGRTATRISGPWRKTCDGKWNPPESRFAGGWLRRPVAERGWRRLRRQNWAGDFLRWKSCDGGVAVTLRRRGVAATRETSPQTSCYGVS